LRNVRLSLRREQQQQEQAMSETNESADRAFGGPLRGARNPFVGPRAVNTWAGIAAFVVAILIVSSAFWG
jgi:hypothetical protein